MAACETNNKFTVAGSAQHKVQKTLDGETWANAGVKEEEEEEDNIA